MMGLDLPTGTVTFLFTDIEGSTQLWEQQPEAMRAALARHDMLLRKVIEDHCGWVIKTTGDGLLAVFASAVEGLGAVIACQRTIHAEVWPTAEPLRVRMALHTGEAEIRDGDYFGSTLNRAARMMAVGAGGQSLLSQTTAAVVQDQLPKQVALRDLGEHRLKDLVRPEHIYQVVVPELPETFPPLKSLSAFPHNLPVQLTSFVGREKEIAETRKLLAATRLLTLTGPGGTGKTRLALQVAADVMADYQDGVWLVELAPLADPAYVFPALAAIFNLREAPGRTLDALVTDYLRGKTLLLVLDNCEHLIEACARLADDLLHVCPRLKVIASSREALGLAGETAYRVPSLTIPDGSHATPAALMQCEAVRLFVERAQAAQPRFTVTASNSPAVAAICRRLDGIPLALELAAARIKVLAAEQIAARLDDRFRLLVGGSRTALPRQQTLAAMIDWSYDLLPEEERRLFRQLSVFAGGWTLEAGEAMVGDCDVLDGLTQLANKSLVIVDEDGAEARYRYLETIRQYARDKLFEAGEGGPVRDRHFLYYASIAKDAPIIARGAEPVVWRRQLEAEADNLRTALEWGLDRHREAMLEMATNLVLAMPGAAFVESGAELRRWLQAALVRVQDLPPVEGEAATRRQKLRGYGLLAEGQVAVSQGDDTVAKAELEEGIAIARANGDRLLLGYCLMFWVLASQFVAVPGAEAAAREGLAIMHDLGDKWGLAMTLMLLSRIEGERGATAQADAYSDEALRLAREIRNPWLAAMMLMQLGLTAILTGDRARARERYTESGRRFREQKDRFFDTAIQSMLAHLDRQEGNLTAALAVYRGTLPKWKELGTRAAIAHELECIGYIARARGHPARAAHLLGAAEALRELVGTPMADYERGEYANEVAALRTQLDETSLARAWAEGCAMTMDDAIQYALADAD